MELQNVLRAVAIWGSFSKKDGHCSGLKQTLHLFHLPFLPFPLYNIHDHKRANLSLIYV